MADLNLVVLSGNVGKDPEIRESKFGKIATFSLATNRVWRNKDGEKQQQTAWHRIVCFNEHITKTIEKYVQKGTRLTVRGRLQDRKYEQDGITKFTVEVEIPKYDGELHLHPRGEGGSNGGAPESRAPATTGAGASDDWDDDVPF